MIQKSKHLNVVSLFTGAGGLDYGFEAAGYRTAVAVECNADCCGTLRANREWPVICRRVEEVRSEDLLEAASLSVGEVDVLVAGPPCQPFSKAGYWVNGDTRRLADPRAQTLGEFMRCVKDLLPTAFVLENVHGIAYSGKEEGFEFLRRKTEELNERHGTNYKFTWSVLNAADYGIPQHRRRFFLVAHRDGRRFQFPTPTHGPSEPKSLFSDGQRQPYATAWDAIGDIEIPKDEDLRVKGRWARLLPSIPEGENYLWHTSRKGGLPLFGWRTAYWSFLLKLSKRLPSWTIQAQPGPAIGPFHWSNRRLAVDELAALQTFPRGLRFIGGRTSIQRQLGNAVPSLLGETLAAEIALQFFHRTVLPSRALAVLPKPCTPDPDPVDPVPEEFLHLAGEHEAHPGTGRGRGAKRRRANGSPSA
jgi:DNA (cytosine-5)-methyltransferase 1